MVAVALIGPRTEALDLPLNWRWSNPAPHGNNIVDMLSTNGVVIQVCDRGQIYSSVDFENWVARESHTTSALRGICFFKGQFVVSGEGGTMVIGNGGLEFQAISLGTTDWLEGVTASPSVAVAVGDNGAIYTSADAAVWQRQTVPFTTWLRSVTFGTPSNQGTFVVVGEQGFVATSNDAPLNGRGAAGTSSPLSFTVTNTGTAAVANVRLTGTAPSGWEVTFDKETIPSIEANATETVIAQIKPSGSAIAGDYVVTLSAAGDESTRDSIEIRYAVETSLIWGIVGAALIVAVIGGVWWVFQRYGRR
jgi:hypothetical protein